jgi:hypothetical protein
VSCNFDPLLKRDVSNNAMKRGMRFIASVGALFSFLQGNEVAVRFWRACDFVPFV